MLRIWAQYCQILQFSERSQKTLAFVLSANFSIRKLYLKMLSWELNILWARYQLHF